jgi:hypothetical protein
MPAQVLLDTPFFGYLKNRQLCLGRVFGRAYGILSRLSGYAARFVKLYKVKHSHRLS